MADVSTNYFAKTNFRGQEKIFGIKTADRRQHTYVVGKTGTGKTNMIKNMAIQDIYSGQGVCVVDPHGELVEELLAKVPESRRSDVIYFNPADTDFPLGFNVLEVPDPKYKHLIAQGLIGIFTKIWANVWSARMEYILQNCILALIEMPGTTLLGVQRILTDREYRQRVLANVSDPVVKAFWLNEFEAWEPRFRNEAIVPIQNKVGQFLSTSLIRNIVGQTKSSFDVYELMNNRKILLMNISKGRIGEENSSLLGAMLITKIQLASMERVRIPNEEDRPDFYLYVDEFQNFATESFASILSEARKYRLNLIIAHQYVGQLVEQLNTKVRDAVFGNVGTMIVFRVGAADAEFLEKEFEPEFLPADLVGLPNYNIYLKLMVNGVTSRPFSATTIPPIATNAKMADRERIIEASRSQYARAIAQVEEEIRQWSTSLPEVARGFAAAGAFGAPAGARGTGEKFDATCWICGKATQLPFKPDGRRPVYCSDCLKKIEAGELRPMRPLPPEGGREQFEGGLEEFGIEFEGRARKGGAPAHPSAVRPPETPKRTGASERRSVEPHRQAERRPGIPTGRVPHIREGALVTRPIAPKRALSLSELRAKARREPEEKKEPALGDLRHMIEETLKERETAPSEQKPAEPAAPPVEMPTGPEKPEAKTLKPGDSIKF
ncbi:MAG: type IV secretion system DNA-binding domain-containing protein [Candidatus Niyogibacteria bacterium]|nr:type IV secretion system DNA-binding domain-containing protein [Candidatus Niyogibacteria bacterium]